GGGRGGREPPGRGRGRPERQRHPPGRRRGGAAAGAPMQLEDLGGGTVGDVRKENLSLLLDVHLNLKVELGRTRMYLEDILKLASGSVVELEKLAGDPLDILVNDRLVARGEVLVLNDNFCVRITEILPPGERVHR
ncbi:MAG: flagellar motor switch protein FliN, partial [Planctomycetes bacterium]|nr:flagellar motor switch protein FliN [Planctomycetota bacterium]